MDIERIKKISEAKINAGVAVNKVRNTPKEYQYENQDVQEELSDVYEPIVKAQEDVKQKIDEKQDKMLEKLQKNQKALTSGLEDLIMIQQLPDVQEPAIGYDIFPSDKETGPLPIDYKPEMLKPQFKSDINAGFDLDEIKKLTEYKLYPPSHVLNASIDGDLDIDEYDTNIVKKLINLGRKKGVLSK